MQNSNEGEDQKPYVAPFIRRLMKNATEEEILEASENLRQYLLVLYRMFVEKERRGKL